MAGGLLILPVLASGWAFGVAGGFLSLFAGHLTNELVDHTTGWDSGFNPFSWADMPGLVAGGIAAVVMGRLSGLQRRLQQSNERLAEAERAFRRSDERFRLAANATNDVLWDWDIQADRVEWADGLLRLMGYDPTLVPSSVSFWTDSVHPEDRARVWKSMEDAWKRRSPTWSDEYRFQRASGSYLWVLDRGFILYADDGRPARMVGSVMDISARREMEAAQEEARLKSAEVDRLRLMDEFKTQILNTTSHELNTPLTAIRLQLALLERSLPTGAPARDREAFALLQRNVQRMSVLVGDTLDLARIQSGTMRIRPEPVDVGKVSREVCEPLQAVARQSNVRLECQVPPGLTVTADPGRVVQVLYNLVGNALKFSKPGDRVRVTGQETNGEVLVQVMDQGVGIAPERMGELFQPFKQVHDASLAVKGTGLGLYISRAILEAHGGRIGCSSPGLGRGSTFFFALPVASVAAPPPPLASVRAARTPI